MPAARRRKQTAATGQASPGAATGLCFRFLCWDAQTGDHTLVLVLCHRCQHSLAWGTDAARLPRKMTTPAKKKDDPDIVLPPVALPCEWCEANGWEPSYEADAVERERRRREGDAAATIQSIYRPAGERPVHRVDDDGQVSLF